MNFHWLSVKPMIQPKFLITTSIFFLQNMAIMFELVNAQACVHVAQCRAVWMDLPARFPVQASLFYLAWPVR